MSRSVQRIRSGSGTLIVREGQKQGYATREKAEEGCPSTVSILASQHVVLHELNMTGRAGYWQQSWHGKGRNQAPGSIQKHQGRTKTTVQVWVSHPGYRSKTWGQARTVFEKYVSVWIAKYFMLNFMLSLLLWSNLSCYWLQGSNMEYCRCITDVSISTLLPYVKVLFHQFLRISPLFSFAIHNFLICKAAVKNCVV